MFDYRRGVAYFGIGAVLAALLLPQFPLYAHIANGATNRAITQNLGPYELRMFIASTDLATAARGPIQATFWLQADPPDGTLLVKTIYVDDATQSTTSSVRFVTGQAGPYFTRIVANRAGQWD